jgi:tRNA(Arg) A34 adenosine deaminase TadA
MTPALSSRRHALAVAAAAAAGALAPTLRTHAQAQPEHPDRKWHAMAVELRTLAESWGDQSYGAVLVKDGKAIGLGPSRVVKDRDPDAHAERVAIREAQRALGTHALASSVLYSTSRPCALCEAAAARAGVSRMVFGAQLIDAGAPLARAP